MTPFDAYFLPQLDTSKLEFRTMSFGSLDARVPVLTPVHLSSIVRTLQHAHDEILARTPIAKIVEAITCAAARLTSPDSVAGAEVRSLLPEITGYSLETIDELLAHMAEDWSARSLNELLRREVGTLGLLDRHGASASCAHGPRLAFHVFSGNVPGIAVTSLIRALLVKSASLGKTASGEPALPVLFARALASVAPDLASALAISYWPGGSEEVEAVALQAADAVVVYGGESTVASVQARITHNARLLVHGPRISFGIVGREAMAGIAREIAEATAAYDQQGCVSPHVVYVERGGTTEPRELAQGIARELEALAARKPRRRLAHGEVLAIRQLRAEVEFRGYAGGDSEVFGAEDTSYTVLYQDALELPVSCLNRTLFVIPLDDMDDLRNVLLPHHALLQSAALSGIPAPRCGNVISLLVQCGVTRITTFERLPWPPMWWHHDGRGPLNELLTWVDIGL